MSIEIAGIYPPIITPFDEKGRYDREAMEHNLERWSETGLAGYVVFGSNGESVHMDTEEKLKVLGTVVTGARGKTVIAGSGLQSTDATAEFTKACADAGAEVALVINPSFYTLTPEAIARHYTAVADASPIPLLIYNVPKFTGVNIPPEVVIELSSHPNIIGIKDSSGDVAQLSVILTGAADGFRVLTGTANVLFAACALGAVGAVTALGNIAPDLCIRLYQAASVGEGSTARKLQLRALPANIAVTKTFGIPGLKRAMDLAGYRGGFPRAPLAPLPEAQVDQLRRILEKAEIL